MSIKTTTAKSILIGLMAQSCACGIKDRLDYRLGKKDRPTFELGQIKVDSVLLPDTLEFIQELNKRNKEYVIDFTEMNVVDTMPSLQVGICFYFNKIEILNRRFSDIKKKLIIFHELGHCILKLEHEPENSNTIMQPVLINDDQYIKDNWPQLVETMINSTNKIKFELYNDRKFDYGK